MGFGMSLLFALIVAAVCTALGVLYGALQGYFAGWADIVMERVEGDLVAPCPGLYMLIIFSALFSPSFTLLVVLISVFGWMALSNYVRAEFLKNRTLDYVRAAPRAGSE